MIRKNVSLASQLVFEILAQIDSGEIISGDSELPSEAAMSRRFNVSRATVREALTKLELGGAVIRRHGVGTYVSPLVVDHVGSVRNWLDEAPNFMDLIQSEGYEAECALLDISIIPAGSMAAMLERDPQTPVISIERLFFADTVPVIYSTNFVSHDLVRPEHRETVRAGYNCTQSIYEFLQQWCDSKIYNQKSEVRAVVADEKMAGLFNCSAGAPLLSVEETGYGLKMKPVFYGLNYFRGENVSFAEMRHPTVWLRTRADT